MGEEIFVITASFISVMLAMTPPVQRDGPPAAALPQGRMQAISGNARGAFFLDLERSRLSDRLADVWVLNIPRQPYALRPDAPADRWVTLSLEHGQIDCDARTYRRLGNDAYNSDGERVVWLPEEPGQPIIPASAESFFARVLCDGETPPSQPFEGGYVAAKSRMALIRPQQP